MSKWISVEERLPENDSDCWVFAPSEAPEPVKRAMFWLDPDYSPSGIWSIDHEPHMVSWNVVTHWMLYYTPDPPQPFFVGCSESSGDGEIVVTTNASQPNDSTRPEIILEYGPTVRVAFDPAAMDG